MFTHMTRIYIHVPYKYLATHLKMIITLPLYITVALNPRTSDPLTKHINSSIHIDVLCKTLIPMLCARLLCAPVD